MLRWACCTIALASNAAGTDVPAVGVSVVFVVAVEAMMGVGVVLFGVLQRHCVGDGKGQLLEEVCVDVQLF